MGEEEENPHVHLAREYTEYLHNPNVYPPRATNRQRINNSALNKEEERLLSSKWRFIELNEIKDTVYTFKVAEVHKGRCRVVHSCKVNDGCKEQENQPPPITLHSFEEVNKILAEADFVTQFDARSMYDQWGLEDEVGKYFVFKDRQGRYVALNRLPMGFCYACGIAQGLSLILTTFSCDTEHYSVTVIVHLDNYLFAFKRKTSETDSQSKELQKAVVSTITTFLKRTITVDLQLNELDREEIQMLLQQNETTRWEKIKSLSPTKFTFLGVDYDLEAKKRTAAEKTWNKLATLLAIIFPGGQLNPATTPRHLAMLMGVASWIKRVINIRHTNFNQYRNMAELAYVLWLMPEMWDVPIAPVAFMFTDLFSICKQLQSTKSANHIYPELRQHNEVAICISDASLVGWGAYIYLPRRHTWDFNMLQGKWPLVHKKPDRLYESSTVAEPKAIEEIIALRPFPNTVRHVLFITDHSPLVAASRSQQARCYTYFKLLQKLEEEKYTYNLLFIKGELNIADAPSRGVESIITRNEHEAIAAGAGVGYAAALLSP